MMRFHTVDGETYSQVPQIVIRVTLADGSTWAVDAVGAQYGQYKPVPRFSEYKRDYVAGFPFPRMPYGSNASAIRGTRRQCPQLMAIEDHQVDELHEWIFKNATAKNLLKAKSTEFETLKKSLVAHLTTATREYVKLSRGDPTCQLRLLTVS